MLYPRFASVAGSWLVSCFDCAAHTMARPGAYIPLPIPLLVCRTLYRPLWTAVRIDYCGVQFAPGPVLHEGVWGPARMPCSS